MGGSEKKRAGTQATKFFVCTYDIFSIKRVTRKFHLATTTARKCTKKSAAQDVLFFLPITSTGFCFCLLLFVVGFFFGRSHCRRRLALHDFIFGLSKL